MTVGIGRSASSQRRMYSCAPSTRLQVSSGKRLLFVSSPTCVWCNFIVEPEGPHSGDDSSKVGLGKLAKAGPRVKSLLSWALTLEASHESAYSR